jgi:hypothetical protein
MDATSMIDVRVAAGWLLTLSGLIFTVGGILYSGRAILNWPAGKTSSYLYWERGFIIAAVLALALGISLLDRLLEAAGDAVLAPSARLVFLIGAVLVIVAETIYLSRQEWVYPTIIVFIVLAYLSQAVFGISILRTGLLPAWVGWATVVWNLAWLVIMPVARPKDMYYPWLHYAAPLLIGIGLLIGL